MISRQRKDEPEGRLREDFEVLGSTGNVSIYHACTKMVDYPEGLYCHNRAYTVLQLSRRREREPV